MSFVELAWWEVSWRAIVKHFPPAFPYWLHMVGRKIHCLTSPSTLQGWSTKGLGFPPRKGGLGGECVSHVVCRALLSAASAMLLGRGLESCCRWADGSPRSPSPARCPFCTSFFQGKTHKKLTLSSLLLRSSSPPWLSPQNTRYSISM